MTIDKLLFVVQLPVKQSRLKQHCVNNNFAAFRSLSIKADAKVQQLFDKYKNWLQFFTTFPAK